MVKVVSTFAFPNPILSDPYRAYGLSLMRSVEPSQVWGVPAGAPPGTVAVKTGFITPAPGDAQVNSIGFVSGGGRSYVFAILTDGNVERAVRRGHHQHGGEPDLRRARLRLNGGAPGGSGTAARRAGLLRAVPRPARRGAARARCARGRAGSRPGRRCGATRAWTGPPSTSWWPTGRGTTSTVSLSSWAGSTAWPRRACRWSTAPAILRWNLDKRYLRDLEAAGVPTVPTSWVEPDAIGRRFDPSAPVLPEDEIVVKPSVSGGGYRTARYEAHEHDAARAHIAELVAAGRTAMVQPYQPAVDTEGEVGLVFLGGAFSHAIHKDPMIRRGAGASDSLIANQVVVGATPTGGQLAVARRAVARGRASARPHHVRAGRRGPAAPTARPPCSSSSSSTPCSSSSRVPRERRASPPSSRGDAFLSERSATLTAGRPGVRRAPGGAQARVGRNPSNLRRPYTGAPRTHSNHRGGRAPCTPSPNVRHRAPASAGLSLLADDTTNPLPSSCSVPALRWRSRSSIWRIRAASSGTVTPLWMKYGYYLVEISSAIAAALLIRGKVLGWIIGLASSVGPMTGYLLSRTVGVPGDTGRHRQLGLPARHDEPPGGGDLHRCWR